MSITSGPIVPLRTGKVTLGEPSEKVTVAVWSVMMSAPSRALRAPASLPAHTKTHSFGRSLLQVGFPSSISPELPSRRAQRSHQIQQSRVRRLRPARDQIPQLVVREIEEAIERRHVFRRHLPSPRVEVPRKDQVVLQHAAPATPAQAIQLGRVHAMHYTARLTMISLI